MLLQKRYFYYGYENMNLQLKKFKKRKRNKNLENLTKPLLAYQDALSYTELDTEVRYDIPTIFSQYDTSLQCAVCNMICTYPPNIVSSQKSAREQVRACVRVT
jgi:hypothetical protein